LKDHTLWPLLPTAGDYEQMEKVIMMLPPSIKVSHTYELYMLLVQMKNQQLSQNTRAPMSQRTPKKTNPLLTHL